MEILDDVLTVEDVGPALDYLSPSQLGFSRDCLGYQTCIHATV